MILLMGPTATGKSALALTLAEALDGEIVSVDSAQVYRGMDIGTAKPDAATRARVAHHLIDLIGPTEAYSAARFCADARGAIAAIRARGRVPILAGGTMLYFKALTEGLSALPRGRCEGARGDRCGSRARRLARDACCARARRPGDGRPDRAARCAAHPARARGGTSSPASRCRRWQGRREAPAHEAGIVRVALIPEDRARLHREIARRFDAMLAAGLVDELASLRAKHALDPAMPSMRCVGYRQAWAHLDGAIDRDGLRAAGIAATRQLAKRQLTWLRATPAARFDPWSDDLAGRVLAAVAGGSR